jgi:DNA polymerase III subunit chi
MAEVDFHILDEDSDIARLKVACGLIEQLSAAGERILVWLDDDSAAASFDNLLWTFTDRAFVPHEMLAPDPSRWEAPIQLSAALSLPAAAQAQFPTLVALREQSSPQALGFARVVEVIDANPARRDAGRARFRFYREQGVTPRHHGISARA